MERTDKFVAKLDKFDTNAFPDRYYDIEEMIYAYKKLNDTDEVVNSHLTALKNIINNARKEKGTMVMDRIRFWEKLLYDFYHIKVMDNNETDKVLYEFYFYPYKVVRSNFMIFGLCSIKSLTDHKYDANGGIFETYFHIFEDLSTHPMEIYYSSEEEMMNNAVEKAKQLIDTRMWKLKYRDKVI